MTSMKLSIVALDLCNKCVISGLTWPLKPDVNLCYSLPALEDFSKFLYLNSEKILYKQFG